MTKKLSREEQEILGAFERLSENDRARILEKATEVDAAIKKKKQSTPFPKHIKLYMHESEENLYEEASALGIPDNERWNPVYEVDLVVEVQADYKSKIIACDGYMIDFSRPFEGETVNHG